MSFSGDQNGVSSTSSEFAVFDGVPGLDGVSSSSRSGGEHRGSLVGGAVAGGHAPYPDRGVVAEGLGSTLQAWGILGMVDVGVATNSSYPKKWMVVENPFTMDDFRVSLFQVISKKIYIYMLNIWGIYLCQNQLLTIFWRINIDKSQLF